MPQPPDTPLLLGVQVSSRALAVISHAVLHDLVPSAGATAGPLLDPASHVWPFAFTFEFVKT